MTIRGMQRFDRYGNEIDPDENNGMLRDGERWRCSMFAADADPLQRAVGDYARRSGADRAMHDTFNGNNRRGRVRRIDAPPTPLIHDGSYDPLSICRPGFRVVSHPLIDGMASEHRRLTDELYAIHNYEESNRWRGDAQQQSLSFDVPGGPGPSWNPRPNASGDLWAAPSPTAYAPYQGPGPSPETTSYTGEGTTANARGLREGDPCMTNDKVRGIVARRNGKIVCVPLGSHDGLAAAMAARDAATASAYAEVEERQANAWRTT